MLEAKDRQSWLDEVRPYRRSAWARWRCSDLVLHQSEHVTHLPQLLARAHQGSSPRKASWFAAKMLDSKAQETVDAMLALHARGAQPRARLKGLSPAELLSLEDAYGRHEHIRSRANDIFCGRSSAHDEQDEALMQRCLIAMPDSAGAAARNARYAPDPAEIYLHFRFARCAMFMSAISGLPLQACKDWLTVERMRQRAASLRLRNQAEVSAAIGEIMTFPWSIVAPTAAIAAVGWHYALQVNWQYRMPAVLLCTLAIILTLIAGACFAVWISVVWRRTISRPLHIVG